MYFHSAKNAIITCVVTTNEIPKKKLEEKNIAKIFFRFLENFLI